ncbi:MAG TPA: hypothetical protein VLG25_02865 [Patescibacteria group bacterium]|nr:hypothetical protein [Patescibacteria group bacterium]
MYKDYIEIYPEKKRANILSPRSLVRIKMAVQSRQSLKKQVWENAQKAGLLSVSK